MGPFCNLKTKTNPQINTNLYITKNNKIIPIFMIKSIYFHSWTPYKVGAKKKKRKNFLACSERDSKQNSDVQSFDQILGNRLGQELFTILIIYPHMYAIS